MKVDVHKQYTPSEALELGISINLFGYPILDKAKDMRDDFLVPPFSIVDACDSEWIKRRNRWNKLIGDKGETREGLLMRESTTQTKLAKKLKDYNGNVSILDACLAELICKWFGVEGFEAFDPFAGDTVFGFVSSYLGFKFQGIDVRQEQVDVNNERLQLAGFNDSGYVCDTSVNIAKYVMPNSKDLVFTCPPYCDMEVYSDNPNDLSTMSTAAFFEVYGQIMRGTYTTLKDNRFAVVVVGEVRDAKTGFYKQLVNKTINTMVEAGYHYYNEIIVVTSIGTLPFRAGRVMSIGRKVGKRHQNVLVFYKGNDHKKIREVFPELANPNDYYNTEKQ